MKIILAFCILLQALTAVSAYSPSINLKDYSFKDYMKDFNKTYDESLYEAKKNQFEQNLAKIIDFNEKDGVTYQQGVNFYTDTDQKEWLGQNKLLPLKREDKIMPRNFNFMRREYLQQEAKKLPKTVDWRNMSSPVKNQGWCLGCWAFSTVETIETHLKINTGKLVELSQQELISCMQYNRTCSDCGGCNADDPEEAYKYVVREGLTSESIYPYQQVDQEKRDCRLSSEKMSKVMQMEGYRKVENITTDELMFILANYGPVTAAVDMSHWGDYKSGVFSGCDDYETQSLNHAISIEGYGTDEEFGDYWLIRNSFSEYWGEKGYIRLKRQQELICKPSEPTQDFKDGQIILDYPPPTCGQCGLQSIIWYPIKPYFIEQTIISSI